MDSARNTYPRRARAQCSAAWVLMIAGGACAQSDFATRVIAYRPAPGQFVQNPAFNDPTAALGPPVGAGTHDGDETKLATLGGFGGYLVLGFDRPVRDDPKNRLGLDFIVFGNSFWSGGDPNRRWAEAATVEISEDANRNGLADDAWYLIPGSHLPVPAQRLESQTWDDDTRDGAFPPAYDWWVPPGEHGLWQTWGFRLPADPFESSIVLINPNGPFATEEGVWGYADLSPTLVLGDIDGDNVVEDPSISPGEFYTAPDDPFEVGVDGGSGGGDAFDIAWAIDAATGAPAGLSGFDFIRITNATNVVLGPFGERSAEVCAVADVRPGLGSEPSARRAGVKRVRRP
ncbi:MAG TPA: hypothetical protein VFF69_06820 [Phycisphaerales bacterium]|nr:hypothetical protein [Phycisphaerales bacterium]